MSGFTKKIMEFFGDDVEEDDDEVENDFEETKENTTQQPVKPQNKVFEKPQQEEKEKEKKVMSIFGVGSKKEESAKMSTTTTASKVSYVSIIRPKVFEDSRLIADAIKENKIVAAEIMPGLMPKVIKKLSQKTHIPIITGGLIKEKEDVINAIKAGALSVSTTETSLWEE